MSCRYFFSTFKEKRRLNQMILCLRYFLLLLLLAFFFVVKTTGSLNPFFSMRQNIYRCCLLKIFLVDDRLDSLSLVNLGNSLKTVLSCYWCIKDDYCTKDDVIIGRFSEIFQWFSSHSFYHFLGFNDKRLLNKRNEFISECRNQVKQLLQSFKRK